ncbi:receptor-like protein 3 [Rosa rugosa]|uniref:receptor-like protein 3 n=1 Tax=Rosa rugosa TaxID=74645 RepID=UPI002B41328E|nr:receptor-like protein 3 [Rosa rugosa]
MARGFLVTLILFFSFISSHIHACNQNERSFLLSFALTLSSSLLTWNSSDCCYWEGITCDQYGFVTHLELPSKGFKIEGGNTFPSLGNLTHLTHLNLSHNSLYGSLDHIQLPLSLNRLEVLDLSHNAFSGSIPSSTCLHSSPLIWLLDFSFNNFSGSISPRLGKCSKLRVFRAGYNNLAGLLPEDIYNATTLEEIELPSNSLYGAISDKIVNLTALNTFDFSYNHFSGVLPPSLGKLSKLKFIVLDSNYLEGPLPPSLMNCTKLVGLRIGANSLEGDISTFNFSKLSQLSKLDLAVNLLTGTVPRSLYSCKSLKAIRLGKNDLEGLIQPEIISLTSLSFLSFSFNKRQLANVTGAVKVLMGCKTLVFLTISSCFLGGEMPGDDGIVEFDGFQSIRLLDLSSCGLTGEIPGWLSKLKKLEILNLDSNRITGSIPSWLGTLPRLHSILLASNQISGGFPKELCRLPMLVHGRAAAQVDRNHLELPIFDKPEDGDSIQYSSLSLFSPMIDLSNNNMSGSIPSEIGQMQFLSELHLSFNNFSGDIPHQISNLKNLKVLDLSNNHLSGKIPASLTFLNLLGIFNVSYNNLEGPITTSIQFQSFGAYAFEGNPKLCGALLQKECQPRKVIDGNEKGKNQDVENASQNQNPWSYISIVLGFITGFWGVCGPLMLKKTWRNAYFQYLDNAKNKFIIVMIRVHMNWTKHKN